MINSSEALLCGLTIKEAHQNPDEIPSNFINLVSLQAEDEEDVEMEEVVEVVASDTADMEMKLVNMALDDCTTDEPKVCWYGLCNAASKGLVVEIQCILEEDPTLLWLVNDVQGTALHIAARARQVGALQQLVHCIMANSNDEHTCRLLLEKDILGDTVFHTVLKRRLESAAHYLIEMAPSQAVYQENNKGASPLSLAVDMGYADLVRKMITKFSASEYLKQSLLSHVKKVFLAHVAVKTNNIGILRALLEELPCLINLPDRKGWKPLSYAASKGYLDQVCYILQKFPDCVNKYDKDGSLPIHKAVAGGHISVVHEFLRCCPQTLCAVDKKGRSNLHIAVRYVKEGVFSYLMKEKDIVKIYNLRTKEGKTFKDLAKDLHDRLILPELI